MQNASWIQRSAFFTVQLSHPYMTAGKTIAPEGLHFSPAPSNAGPWTWTGMSALLRETVDGGKKQKLAHAAQGSQSGREPVTPTPA